MRRLIVLLGLMLLVGTVIAAPDPFYVDWGWTNPIRENLGDWTTPGGGVHPISYEDYTHDQYGNIYAPAVFPDGEPIPEDYVCPVHGTECPNDPRNIIVGTNQPVVTQTPRPVPTYSSADIQERLDYYGIQMPTYSGYKPSSIQQQILERLSQFL